MKKNISLVSETDQLVLEHKKVLSLAFYRNYALPIQNFKLKWDRLKKKKKNVFKPRNLKHRLALKLHKNSNSEDSDSLTEKHYHEFYTKSPQMRENAS